jgi:hypothetical protein
VNGGGSSDASVDAVNGRYENPAPSQIVPFREFRGFSFPVKAGHPHQRKVPESGNCVATAFRDEFL